MFCSRRCNEGRVAVGNRQEEDDGVRRTEKVLKYETWFIICRFASCKFALCSLSPAGSKAPGVGLIPDCNARSASG